MKARALAILVALVCVDGAVAQNARERQEEFARAQRLLQKNRSEVSRLIDLRFRHDLGLKPEVDPSMPRMGPISTVQKERMMRELREHDGQTASLLGRFNDLKSKVEMLRADAAARAEENAEEQFLVVPSAGAMSGGSRERPVEAVDSNPARPGGSANLGPAILGPANPGPNGQGLGPLPAGAATAVRLGRVRGQIRGSDDHLRVAQSLFRAGQALADAAELSREEGNEAVAIELDNRAKERLGRAVAELEPLLAAKEPLYQALFCKGRCLELLFRHSMRYDDLSLKRSTKLFQQREQEVREPFLAIAARDVEKSGTRGDLEVLGPWGMAANTAVEHFRWMNLHGSYRPAIPIESITWPGEKDL